MNEGQLMITITMLEARINQEVDETVKNELILDLDFYKRQLKEY